MLHLTEEETRLLARADELLARACTGEITATPYLTPREQAVLAEHFAHAPGAWELNGGYSGAERMRALFLPDYVQEAEGALREELLLPAREELFVPVRVCGSGYRELAHRDYLGAVLACGIRRDAVGDVCVLGANEAVLLTDRVLADFLCRELTRVGSDAVRVSETVLPPDFNGGRQLLSCRDTVPSPRADAVVAAICHLSRERAQALFREKCVEISYEPVEKPDRQVQAGEVLVVRGYGKFLIRELSEQTKKGRLRLLFDRYM